MEHITKGNWEAYLIEMPDTWMVCSGKNGDDGVAKMIDENQEANAHLIAAAVNACIKVNPDNPQAVADSIGDMYEALKEAGIHLEIMHRGSLPSLGKSSLQVKVEQALAKAEEK